MIHETVETAMTRDEAIELLLMHAVACSEYLFKGLVSDGVRDTMEPRARIIMDKYGPNLVKRTIEAFELLATPFVVSVIDYESVDGELDRELARGPEGSSPSRI